MVTDFLVYVLKANIAIGVFYIFYRLFLRRDTFYNLNRIYFIVALLLAAVFPAVDFSAFFPAPPPLLYFTNLPPDANMVLTGVPSKLTFNNIAATLIVVGSVILLIRLVLQLGSLARLYKGAKLTMLFGKKVANVSEKINPFSFFGWIFVNPTLHNNDDLHEIVVHESIHVQQYHSLDIMAYEVAAAICWFNPFIWLMRKAMKQNIEFLADKQTLEAGYDKRHYQYNLLRVSQIGALSSIVNNFNFNDLRNRIAMMNKRQSAKQNLLKYGLIIPVFIGAALIVNAQNVKDNNDLTNIEIAIQPSASKQLTAQSDILVENTQPNIELIQTSKTEKTSTENANNYSVKIQPEPQDTAKPNEPNEQMDEAKPTTNNFTTIIENLESKTMSGDNGQQASIAVIANSTGTTIAFDKDTHEFGTIIEANGKASAIFTFTNIGNKPLVINDVVPSCGCTAPEWTKEPVQPGAVGYLRAIYDPKGRIGPFDKTLLVASNGEPSKITLHIKGVVVEQ